MCLVIAFLEGYTFLRRCIGISCKFLAKIWLDSQVRGKYFSVKIFTLGKEEDQCKSLVSLRR